MVLGAAENSMPASLAERLRQVEVVPRADLEVTRHVFHGAPTYVVQDPITFQSHSLSPDDYRLFVGLEGEGSLDEKFNALVDENVVETSDEELFYQFTLDMHRLGLLSLPIAAGDALYRRYEKRRQLERRSRITGFLFWRIPLWNPDAFLNNTVRYVRFLFTPAFLVLWAILMVAAGAVAASRWDDLSRPILSVFNVDTLPLMWLMLIGLKICHEFGHAYACKAFGGRVPEMGAFLIVFTPCAYVDATAAWGFPKTRHRLAVNLAGVYFESMIAAVALFIWASTGPSLLNTAAYQAMLLSSIVTIGFNINPLARFDGYYVLSDITGIPNLRARASEQVMIVLKRVFLGLRSETLAYPGHIRAGMFTYGVGAATYRVMIMLGITLLIATKSAALGVALAGVLLGSMALTSGLRLGRFLLFSPTTANVRRRSVALAVVAFVIFPIMFAAVPVSWPVEATGRVRTERFQIVRADEPGFLQSVSVKSGQFVRAGDHLASLENVDIEQAAAIAQAEVELAELRSNVARAESAADAEREMRYLDRAMDVSLQWNERSEALSLSSTMSGRILNENVDDLRGRFFRPGEVVLEIGEGAWIAQVLIDEQSVADALPKPGDPVTCKTSGNARAILRGSVISVAPVGSRDVSTAALSQQDGGSIAANPSTGLAGQPYFEVLIRLDEQEVDLRHGATIRARFRPEPRTIGARLIQNATRFFNRIQTG